MVTKCGKYTLQFWLGSSINKGKEYEVQPNQLLFSETPLSFSQSAKHAPKV